MKNYETFQQEKTKQQDPQESLNLPEHESPKCESPTKLKILELNPITDNQIQTYSHTDSPEDPEQEKYTTILCNRVFGFQASIWIITFLSVQSGAFSGYISAIKMILQKKGISYNQQSLLSTLDLTFL